MGTHEASRTLVKSPPELWAECSNAASLARHLGQFGEIRITKLEPETAVAWEGSAASGTVRLEPAGWGTKVILTATEQTGPEPAAQDPPERDPEPVPESSADPEPEPEPAAEPPVLVEPAPRGRFARLLARFGARPAPVPVPVEADPALHSEPEPEPEREPESEERRSKPAPVPVARADGNPLDTALDSLGSAHHRPYSRA